MLILILKAHFFRHPPLVCIILVVAMAPVVPACLLDRPPVPSWEDYPRSSVIFVSPYSLLFSFLVICDLVLYLCHTRNL